MFPWNRHTTRCPFPLPYSRTRRNQRRIPASGETSMMLGRALRGRGKSPAPLSGGKQPQEKQQPGEASEARELARSAGGFVLGLVLASLYGAVVLLAQGHNVWYCLLTTSSLGTALGLGMAFSTKLQVTVLLSLPHIFTREGKMLMLMLALGMAVQGPCSNIVQNFSRAAESLSCGAELTLNQTAERLQRAQEPLLSETRDQGDTPEPCATSGGGWRA
ncbi:dc-stamp domain-containing protein 2 [Limosa lapponica baueri]|uniref:Dc-stamp domain-containing protein 2 n=1 Tax=Limosa lapponica baueri TaxID=1758121 RepID=A0A2I0T0N3_LIMLA|nr:dc-stamp domain-containing protein 2 [Limosa lapponica baueri]